MDKNKNIKNLAAFFFEAGTLRKIPRAHQQTLLSQDLSDNIASHSFRTTIIGYFLAKELKADADKVVKMCLFHDLEEARSGDQNWVNKKYLKIFEEEIRKEQLQKLANTEELLELSKEYQQRKTLEAKIAKDADLLDQIFILKEYYWQGNKEAGDWLKFKGKCQQEKLMFTKLARQLATEAKKQNPSDWWASSWTSIRR
jgi:putative hydrolase of HD superfamily